MRIATSVAAAALIVSASHAGAQWDPANAQWGKDDPNSVRVMTWNVEDGLCRTNDKEPAPVGSSNNWDAIVRIVAGLKPDVLILQECGDNSGNGTGGGVDTTVQLEAVIDLMFNGGTDPWNGGAVTSYVQLYAPGYTLPHIYVSTSTDNFNRNVIVSRYPFTDLNGDGTSTYPDMRFVQADQSWSLGGNGGIRGHMFTEIDLPNDTYLGDLVIGNAHLKAGGSSSDFDDRERAARNVSYFIHYWYNGAGTGTPDPNSKISDAPQATQILDADTPVIWGGDWNENDNGSGTPRDWFAEGPGGANDGTDRDLTDSTSDSAVEFFTGDPDTQSNSKLDYLCWQDSIATAVNQFVFNSASTGGNYPPELIGYVTNPLFASARASDHRPVIVDFDLPLGSVNSPPGAFDVVYPNTIDTELDPMLEWSAASDADDYDLVVATDVALSSVVYSQSGLTGTTQQMPAGLLARCETYYWGVTAHNAFGSTNSTSYPKGFNTWKIGDVTTTGAGVGDPGFGEPDGQVTAADINFYVNAWVGGDLANADLTTTGAGVGDPNYGVPDGQVTGADINYFVNAWVNNGCP